VKRRATSSSARDIPPLATPDHDERAQAILLKAHPEVGAINPHGYVTGDNSSSKVVSFVVLGCTRSGDADQGGEMEDVFVPLVPLNADRERSRNGRRNSHQFGLHRQRHGNPKATLDFT